MKNYLKNIVYLKRKERKSTLFLIFLLLMTSFIDDAFRLMYFGLNSGTKDEIFWDETSPQNQDINTVMLPEKQEGINQNDKGIKTYPNANKQPDIKKKEMKDESVWNKTFEKNRGNNIDIKSTYEKNTTSMVNTKLPQKFNPNEVKKDSLITWGVSEFAANNWIKYLDSGGKINSPDQLSKVYGLDSVTLERLKPLARIPDKKKPEPRYTKREMIPFDINSATSDQLQSISGIGQVISSRIIAYRDKLGGFHDVLQLKEVYGVQDSVVDQNLSILQINTEVRKIQINKCLETELTAHPYFSAKQSKVIINNRNQHGPFRSVSDLSRIAIMDEQWLERISPYMEF